MNLMDGTDRNALLYQGRTVPVLLDLTRLVSRVGKGADTGVDRVERAYLDWALESSLPVFSVVRTSAGISVLNRGGTEQLRDRLSGLTNWGKPDLRAVVGIKTPTDRSRAESDVRRLSVAPPSKTGLPDVKLPPDCIYLNVGHSNLSREWLAEIKAAGLKRASFVHDVIPMEFPQFQRPETVAGFEAKLDAVLAHSDIVITNSVDTKTRLPDAPSVIVAPLGIGLKNVQPEAVKRNRPYFITIGTIEPRKNHALLLDIWETHRPEADLFIVGQRGWNNAAVFQRLDDLKGSPRIFERNDVPDDELAALLKGATALLFPSFAEGFGLPGLEAASMGVPVICGDLAIHRETMGRYPVYADTSDLYEWKNAIDHAIAGKNGLSEHPRPNIPTWADHFAILDPALSQLVEHA